MLEDEFVLTWKIFWVDKIQKGPYLLGVVLDGCASEEGPAGAWEAIEGEGKFAVAVFEAVGFVNDDVLEG